MEKRKTFFVARRTKKNINCIIRIPNILNTKNMRKYEKKNS